MADENTPASEDINAATFVKRVKQANPELLALSTTVDVAAAEVIAVRRLENPSLAYDREEVFDRGDGLPENQVTLAFPIDISGRRGLLAKRAEAGVAAARLETEAARVDFVSDSLKVYYRTAAWQSRLQALKTSKQAMSVLIETVRDRAAEGDASGYDLSRVEIELVTLNDLIAEAERELARGQLLLGALTGAPGTVLKPSDTLQPVTPSDTMAQNEADHPYLAAVKHRITASELEQDAAGRKRVPILTLTGGMKTAPDGDDTLFGYVAGVAVTLPFFDNGRAEREKAAAEGKRARAERDARAHRIETDIHLAKATLAATIAQAKQFETDQLPMIEKLLDTAEVAFKEGERPIFELLDAHRATRELRLRHLDLLLNAHMSLIDLNAALGRIPGENR